MKATILIHIDSEGPGTLGSYLREAGATVEVVRLHRGEPLPPQPAGLIVSMGGPMNALDDENHPFLALETAFLRRAITAGLPVVGVCLGAQLIARAAGARIYRAPEKEVGWGTVRLTADGRRDSVFGALPDTLPVLQWHEDTFDLPAGGTLLASSALCPRQAFRVGRAFGLQFHVEVDGEMLSSWFSDAEGRQEILSRYREMQAGFDDTARRLYAGIVGLAFGAAP